MLKEMTRKQERRFIAAIVLIVLLLFMLERVYNNRDEFQVVAKDESYYGIVEAKLRTKEKKCRILNTCMMYWKRIILSLR